MNGQLQIGSVIEVRNLRIKIQVEKDMNHSTLIYNGEIIKNLTVNGFIIIRKGIIDLIGKIDAEYIEDLLNTDNFNKDERFNTGSILRILEVQIIGYMENGTFDSGIKHMPMIGNIAYIPTKNQVESIYLQNTQEEFDSSANKFLSLGSTLNENIEVSFPINSFIASHLGVFGNTGSGKSNTVAKIYEDLFKKVNIEKIKDKSEFHLLDFNGEYAHDGVFGLGNDNITTLKLNSSFENGKKIKLLESNFYNSEILSILFSATEQTQKPFIKRLAKRMKKAREEGWTLKNWLPSLYAKALSISSKEIFEYLKEIIETLPFTDDLGRNQFLELIAKIEWHSINNKWFITGQAYFDSEEKVMSLYSETSGYNYLKFWCETIVNNMDFKWCDEFVLNAKLHLVQDMLNRHAQFDHIKPLIYRIESRMDELENIIEFVESPNLNHSVMNIYSFRECSTEIKKIIPVLLAKVIFDEHKRNTAQDHINKSLHFIIDEAHNILSSQNNKEDFAWQDYRVSLFEEIIKEGRKFGVFLTISSQRPFDISPTIISQIHNYFLHRLVNEKDLQMIENTIPTLDKVSKTALPTLSKGSCIVTGVALAMPVVIQINQLNKKAQRPSSDDIDLLELWEHSYV